MYEFVCVVCVWRVCFLVCDVCVGVCVPFVFFVCLCCGCHMYEFTRRMRVSCVFVYVCGVLCV